MKPYKKTMKKSSQNKMTKDQLKEMMIFVLANFVWLG